MFNAPILQFQQHGCYSFTVPASLGNADARSQKNDLSNISPRTHMVAVVSWLAHYAHQGVLLAPKLMQSGTASTFQSLEFHTPRSLVRAAAAMLRSALLGRFTILSDIVATDRLNARGRFVVKYLFFSPQYHQRVTLTTFTNETRPIPSLRAPSLDGSRLFPAAGWLEREVWDLFGIYFTGHGDNRRILTDYGFQGHPLRKDFPLSGYTEVLYSDSVGRLVARDVVLAQQYRVYKLDWLS